MSYLKLVANPADDEAFRRAIAVPKRGLGDATLEQLSAVAREAGVPMLAAAVRPDLHRRAAARGAHRARASSPRSSRGSASRRARRRSTSSCATSSRASATTSISAPKGPESADRIDNVRELITGAAETVADEEGEVGLTPLDHFLQKAMLVSELDKLGPDADAVTLMTLHNAKGLEFPVVFISGLEDGLFPARQGVRRSRRSSRRSDGSSTSGSRAPSGSSILTHAEERRRNGEFMPSKASSFLVAIPEDMLEQRMTIKVRSSGRSFMHSLGGGSQWGNSRRRDTGDGAALRASSTTTPAFRRAPRCVGRARRSRARPASTTPRRRRTPP